MFNLIEMLDPISDMVDELAEGAKGARLTRGIAKFTRRIYQGLLDEGFNHDDAIRLTESLIKNRPGG